MDSTFFGLTFKNKKIYEMYRLIVKKLELAARLN
jgi:hypothetical protein